MVFETGLLAKILSSYLLSTYLLWTGELNKFSLQEAEVWDSYIFAVLLNK